MSFLMQGLTDYGIAGLVVAAAAEAVFSPILPDVLLIPLALAQPEHAIFYGLITTIASVLSGCAGFALGKYFGIPMLKRFVAERHLTRLRAIRDRYGVWAVFAGALLPIPYKVIALSAGMFQISFPLFLLASVLGRAKRFLLEGVLIYYWGPKAIELFQTISGNTFLLVTVLSCTIGAAIIVKLAAGRESAG